MAKVVNKTAKVININKAVPLSKENKKKKALDMKLFLSKIDFAKIREVLKRNNIITYVMMGIALFVFSLIISAQLNTVGNTNIIASGMREAELLSELSKSKNEYKNLKLDYDKSQKIVDEYKSNKSSTNLLVGSMTEDLNKANILAGLVDLKGEGILITINDSPTISDDLTIEAGLVHDTDITAITTELKAAGVEVMSINGQRIIATTAIRCVGPTIQVNSVKIAAPFYIKAIGNASYLESALNIKGGIVDSLRGYGIQIKIERQKNIIIEKYDATLKFRVAKPVEQGGR